MSTRHLAALGIEDPTLTHDTPRQLARDRRIPRSERLRRLRQWRDLVHQQIRAAGEGMSGPVCGTLAEVESALRTLRSPKRGDAMTMKTLNTMNERLRSHGARIRALVPERALLGGAGGFSAKITSLRQRHRAAGADLVRLTSTPESEEDWQRLYRRLDAALEKMGEDLSAMEVQPHAPRRAP